MPQSAWRRTAVMVFLGALIGCTPFALQPPPTVPTLPEEEPAVALSVAQAPRAIAEPQDLYEVYEEHLRTAYTRDWRQDVAALRWNDIAIDYLDDVYSSPPCMARILTLMHMAIHETMRQVQAKGGSTAEQEAAAAFAAAQTLSYCYYGLTSRFMALAAQDPAVLTTDAALAERRAHNVTGRLIAHARSDGAHQRDAYTLEPLPGQWYHPDPIEPTAGHWRPWVIASGDAVSLPAPPRPGSPEFATLLQQLHEAQAALTPTRKLNAVIWSAVLPPIDFNRVAAVELLERGYPSFVAAEVMMWLNIVQADALIVTWKVKYDYRLPRPDDADPTFVPFSEQPEAYQLFESMPIAQLVPDFAPYLERFTPRHPAYTSGHSTNSMAAAVYLSHVFPDESALWFGLANASGLSRIDLGVHYPINHLGAQVIGQAVAEQVIDYLEATGGVYRKLWPVPAL